MEYADLIKLFEVFSHACFGVAFLIQTCISAYKYLRKSNSKL